VPEHDTMVPGVIEPPAGVRVEVRPVNHQVEIQVEDDGPGIPADNRERIWHPFERATTANRGETGTGLGLTIVRALVEAMDGAVRYDATAPTGARFVVTLPRHLDNAVVTQPLVGHPA
jgi:signal transduction histidine kinase